MSIDKKVGPSGQDPKKPAPDAAVKKHEADKPLTDAELAKVAGGELERPKVGWD